MSIPWVADRKQALHASQVALMRGSPGGSGAMGSLGEGESGAGSRGQWGAGEMGASCCDGG